MVIGVITGMTKNESALDRYLIIAPEVKRLLDGFEATHDISRTKETNLLDEKHYQLTGLMASRLQQMLQRQRMAFLSIAGT